MGINDFCIDVRDINSRFEINVKNPHYNIKLNSSLHEKLLVFLNDTYVSKRNILQKVIKEDDGTKYILDSREGVKSFRKEVDNSAGVQINLCTGEEESAFYRPEYIQFDVFVPKVSILNIKQIIKDLLNDFEAPNSYRYDHLGGNFDEYLKTDSLFIYTRVVAFAVKKDTTLGQFFSSCEINISRATASFVRMNFRFNVNKKWGDIVSSIATSNEPDYYYFGNLEKVKLRNFRRIEQSVISGAYSKNYHINCIFEEMKFVARYEMNRYFNLFSSFYAKSENDAFIMIETNVEANMNNSFWHSVGITSFFCYLCQQYRNACITFAGSNMLCIYRKDSSYEDSFEYFKYDIGNELGEFIAFNNMKDNCNYWLTETSRKVKKADNQGIEIWFEMKRKSESESEYLSRFLSEYQMKYESELRFETIEGHVFALNYEERSNSEIVDLNEKIKLLNDLIDRRLSVKNTLDSFNIQHQTFITNFVSALFAFIAIIISLLANESNKIYMVYLIQSKPLLFAPIILLLLYVLGRFVFSILRKPFVHIKKKKFYS